MQHQQHLGEQGSGLHLGAPQFEPMGIDAMPFDYGSQFVPSMDSPNINIDYNQQQVIIICLYVQIHRPYMLFVLKQGVYHI